MKTYLLLIFLLLGVLISFFLKQIFFPGFSFKKDYTYQAECLAKIIDDELIKLNIYPYNIIKEDKKYFQKERIKWVYFTKKIIIPASCSINKYQKRLSERIKKLDGKIIVSREYKDYAILKIGINSTNIYCLTFIKMPALAIIIDDLGYKKKVADDFLNMKIPLTLAVLPSCFYSSYIIEEALKKQFEIILHLPMEPLDSTLNPGKYALVTDMNPNEIIAMIERNIKVTAGLKGVNNHMGSKIMPDEKILFLLFKELKKRNLYFIDSQTTKYSKADIIAQKIGIRFSKNDIFIDNEKNIEYIKQKIQELIKFSLKKGKVIAIGHAYKPTVEAIKESIPFIKAKGVELFYVSQVLE